jgi:DNA polymerase-3 subunit gamma/tau
MVFYRKYRPQTIEELDSKSVRDSLTAVLSSKSISHAFLFTGPKGLGKTSTARIVAKVVNCEKRQLTVNNSQLTKKNKESNVKSQMLTVSERIEPCNKCYQCISITNGSNIDILEIDGASNRGIDEIRDLREKIRLAPAAALKKVYIIDEVHMLTTEAFNALLKTLEEPPNHVIFVLCTTEPHKVPATIVSRCFHVPFKKATIDELVRSFERIAEKEKLKIDDETLQFIASLSDGSFRDGAKILEEMKLTSDGEKITKELVEEKYQVSSIKYQVSKMIEFLSKKNIHGGLKLVSELVEQGVDMKYFLEQLTSELHEMLLVQVGAIEISNINPTTCSGQKSKMSMEEIKELVELLGRAYGELKYAVLPQLPLELAIVEWGVQKTQNTQMVRESDSQKVRGSDSPKIRLSDSPSFPSVPKVTPMDTFWKQLIDHVKLHNHSIAGVLRGCRLKSYDNKKIVIETGYKFHKERLEEKKTREIIEKVCEEIAERPIEAVVVLREKS